MSTDFIALFDVAIDEVSLEWLLPLLVERSGIFEPFVERYGHHFPMKTWTVEPGVTADSRPALTGPGGFAIRRDGAVLELWHGVRFSMFTGDPWHRGVLRRVCREIGALVGSERAIYAHELMPYAGMGSLGQIESFLRSQIGPPADTFEELHAAEHYGPRAWYVDLFANLRELSPPSTRA